MSSISACASFQRQVIQWTFAAWIVTCAATTAIPALQMLAQARAWWIREFFFPSKITQHSYWKLPFIVDLPIKNGDFPQLCKRLLEGFHSSEYFQITCFSVSHPSTSFQCILSVTPRLGGKSGAASVGALFYWYFEPKVGSQSMPRMGRCSQPVN